MVEEPPTTGLAVANVLPGVGVPEQGGIVDHAKLKSSTAVTGLFPDPVELDFATILIQTGPDLSSNAVPKLTVTFVLPQDPVVVVSVVGEEVAFVKLVGVAPKP